MSDTKKKFPINKLGGYEYIKSQYVTNEGVAIYDIEDNQLGSILTSKYLDYPFFYPKPYSIVTITLDQIKEITRYMEFIQRFGISVEFEEEKHE
jgi:hypothetical protein